MTTARKVHWLCDSPSPYNAQLFRALAAEPDVDLLVHYQRAQLSSHPWQSDLTGGYASRTYKKKFEIDWYLIRLALAPKRFRSETFVVGSWNHPTAWLLLTLLALRRGNFATWTDTPNLTRNRPRLRRFIRQAFLSWILARARYVMGTGKAALSALQQMGAPPYKLINFPFWIDLKLYEGGGKQANENVVFLSCGRLENDLKGHDVALRALALAYRHGARSFQYRIAGVGPDAEVVRHLADELGLCDRVKLLGWLDPVDMIEEMKAADVLIHPSPYHDPYPVAIIEAMAAGMVVMVSDVSGSAERVEILVNGFIHRAGDVEQLAAQVRELLNDRSKIARMSAASRKTAERWPISKGVMVVKQLIGEPRRL